MTNPLPTLLGCICVGLNALTLPVLAQATLLHSIPAPPVGVQGAAFLGYSVAVEGVPFHRESILTRCSHDLLRNFIGAARKAA